jgi:hypothetical protein
MSHVTFNHQSPIALQAASDKLVTLGPPPSVPPPSSAAVVVAPPKSPHHNQDELHHGAVKRLAEASTKLRSHDAELERSTRNMAAVLRR